MLDFAEILPEVSAAGAASQAAALAAPPGAAREAAASAAATTNAESAPGPSAAHAAAPALTAPQAPAQVADPGTPTDLEASAGTPIAALAAIPAEGTQLVAVPTASAVAGFYPNRLAEFNISEEMALEVSEATALGDLEKHVRDRIHKRITRMSERNEFPQALAAEWAVAKSDKSGAKQLSFMRLWLENNGTFGGRQCPKRPRPAMTTCTDSRWAGKRKANSAHSMRVCPTGMKSLNGKLRG